MKYILTISLLLFSIFNSYSIENKTDHSIEGNANIGANFHSADFTGIPGIENCCPGFTSGSGFAYSLGLTYLYSLNSDFSLLAGVDFADHSAELITNEEERINIDGDRGIRGIIEHSLNSNINSLGFNIGARYNITENLVSDLSYRIGAVSTPDYQQRGVLKEPEGVTFSNGSRVWTESEGEFAASDLLHSINGRLGYKFPLNENGNLEVIPSAGFSIGLNNIIPDSSWTSNSLYAGVSISYNLMQSDEKEELEEIEKRKQEEPKESNEVNVFKEEEQVKSENADKLIVKPVISKDGEQLSSSQVFIEEILSTRLVPLLNYVFFDHNSSEIPIRYKLMEKDETRNFNQDNLFNVETLEIYHNILNIIGKRLIENPKANIILVGNNSNVDEEKDNKVLSVERAKSVRKYLTDVWGIRENRIKLDSKNLPERPTKSEEKMSEEENRRVEIYSDDENILKPLVMNDTLFNPITENMKFYTVVDTNLKVYSWSFVIRDESGNIFDTEGRGSPPFFINWKIGEKEAFRVKDDRELSYRFEINSKEDELKSVSGKIKVNVKTLKEKKEGKEKDKRIDKYSLILFDFDEHALNERNESILDYIKSNVKEDSELVISGYSDKIGDEDYNKKLSEKRSNEVAEFFPENEKEIYSYGESIIIFNNNLPEGRFYSRTVQIEVITPIEAGE